MANPVNLIDPQGNKIATELDSSGKPRLAIASSDDCDLLLDSTTTANVTYIGKALIGSSTSAAVWQIKKIDETSGLAITWGGGVSSFNQIWANRASLTYA